MSRFEGIFTRLKAGAELLSTYWKKSPSTKIILINTGVYVLFFSTSACGNSKSYQRISWSSIFHAKDSIFSQVDFIPLQHTPSRTWEFLV